MMTSVLRDSLGGNCKVSVRDERVVAVVVLGGATRPRRKQGSEHT